MACRDVGGTFSCAKAGVTVLAAAVAKTRIQDFIVIDVPCNARG
jgi:hypothetical protein